MAADDGTVGISFPVSDRTEGDTRANALSFVLLRIDPAQAATDLRDIRGAIGQALQPLRATPEGWLQLLALARLTPKRVRRRLADVAYGYTDVGCSNTGNIDPAVARADGPGSDRVFIRG